jgi:chaperone modulatory protein CbpM
MRIETTEVLWFEQHVLSLTELSQLSGLSREVLAELLDCGAIEPLEDAGPGGVEALRFGAAALRSARAARRLRSDFDLDVQALIVALKLMDRVAELEAQLTELRAQLPQRVR